MTLQTVSTPREASEVNRWRMGRHLECDDEEVLNVESVLGDAIVHVGALIDGICCRYGDWVDWQRYRPHLTLSPGHDEGLMSVISLALAENDCGLRAGGFIEIRVLSKGKTIETNGGYYDDYNQPRSVIEGYLSWHEATRQRLGQALLLMYDRIMKAYWKHADLGVSAEEPLDLGTCGE